MSHQPSVVEYFNSRKRPAVDDLKSASAKKVLVLEHSSSISAPKENDGSTTFAKKLVYTNKGGSSSSALKKSQSATKPIKKPKKSDGNQMDIRKTLFQGTNKKIKNEVKEIITEKSETAVSNDKTVEPSPEQNVSTKVSEDKEESKTDSKTAPKTPEGSTSSSRKELNLGNIKAMMSRSSRLEEMKAALKRFNEKKAQLEESQGKSADPSLDSAERIELEVPVASPMKTPKKGLDVASPQRRLTPCSLFATPPRPVPASPLKSPLKSPAFQRYQALVTEGRPVLELPFKFRALAELFRCVDQVASMIHNRRETITLSNLKPGVQEISRKTLTEYQLGEIKTIFPNSFDFKIEKMKSFGAQEKYELIITPLLSDFLSDEEKKKEENGKHQMMNPAIMLSRQRTLYHNLLELTKDHHEEFLKSLEVPMCIPRFRLTRWHPEFPVDDVPDIISAALPQPPNQDRVTTAKDVLERARSLFMVNPRMERALQRVSENSAPSLTAPSSLDTAPGLTSSPAVKSALSGVPASLLEKVRAKQAARALEAMTRTPAQAKEAVRLTRLPEIARIVRNLFVAEKKSVLTREQVLRKLGDSYRESLTTSDLDDHLKLLADKTSGWITFCNVRKTDYVKLSRNVDMSRVMTRLETLAEEKCL